MAAVEVPVLETARLVLRAPAARDWPAYRALMTSERSRGLGGPFDAARAFRDFAVEIAHWELRGFGPWALCLKGTDESLGLVGPWFPEGWPEREISWLLWAEGEGRGYAREAAEAALAYVFGVAGWDTAVSYVDPENMRSIALAERLGAVRDPAAAPLSPGDIVFRHAAPARRGSEAA